MLSVFVVGCQINQGWTFNAALNSREDAAEKEYKWWLFMVIWHVQSLCCLRSGQEAACVTLLGPLSPGLQA